MGRGEVLPDFRIRELIGEGVIVGGDKNLVNPSSLDLRVGLGQWKLLGSYYHIGNERLEAVLGSGRITDSEYAEGGDFYVDLNQPYMTRLMEGLDFSGLSNELSARIFNKSGRGRVGISVKGVTDPFYEFGTVPQGFSGNLYAEICATAFPVTIQPEQIAIPQIRFYNGDPTPLRGLDLGMLLREHPILTDDKGNPSYDGEERKRIIGAGQFTFTADLSRDLLVYKANGLRRTLVLSRKDHYEPHDFFDEVRHSPSNDKRVVILPGEFALIKSKQNIRLPPHICAEIAGYSQSLGDAKTSYADLINAGHGHDPDSPNVASYIVFEVSPIDMPLILQDSQPIAKFELHRMLDVPEQQYHKEKSTDFGDLESILPTIFKRS